MKVALYENEVQLSPSKKGESEDLNQWFNTLGSNSKGAGNFGPGLSFDAKVHVIKSQTSSGVQLQIRIEVTT